MKIPVPIIAVISKIISDSETGVSLYNLLDYAGVPDYSLSGASKLAKIRQALYELNDDNTVNPMVILGRLIEDYMEMALKIGYDELDPWGKKVYLRREKIKKALAEHQLEYIGNGVITNIVGSPSLNLNDLIRKRDFSSVNQEFDRALANVEISPREAISAACNILEALCKIYIEDQELEMPAKQDLQPVWKIVSKDLGFEPKQLVDKDLQEILSGIIAVVSGIGALRTHGSSAHAQGRKQYNIEPRHARLAIHSAHTIAMFIMESWDKKKHNI